MLILNKPTTTDRGPVVYVLMATKQTLPKTELEFNENLPLMKMSRRQDFRLKTQIILTTQV